MKSSSPPSASSPVATTELGSQPFQHDPEFRGPVKNRSCTDIICLFLLIFFMIGWAVVSIFAFQYGDPRVLLYPTDSYGNICGLSSRVQSKPHLYFFDLAKCAKPSVIYKGCKTPQVCVSHCPNETLYYTPQTVTEADKDKLICKLGTDMSKPASELIKNEDCASLYLKSKPLLGRCIPDELITNIEGAILDAHNETIEEGGEKLMKETILKASKFLAKFLSVKEFGKQIFSDLKNSWKIIVIGLLLCMLVTFLWVVVMRWIAGIMVWLSIVLVLLLFGYASYYCITMAIKTVDSKTPDAEEEFTTNLGTYQASKRTWIVLSIIFISGLVILLLMLLFLRKRIRIAIALIKEGSRAIGCMFTTLFFPIFPYLLELAFLVFWGAVALYIAASGRATYVSNDDEEKLCIPDKFNLTDKKCLFLNYGDSDQMYVGQAYNLFAALWAIFFVIGVGQVSLAGAFAAYYWTMEKSNVPTCAIGVGVYRCLRYHLGSVAFGSLLIATVRFIRILLEYIDHKCKKYDNAFTKAILCCMKCCFWLLEKFLKFISKNAYIMIAVYGKNFCTSARTAFGLLIRNAVRVVVIDKVTDFLLLIGKLVIVGSAAAASFYVFSGHVEFLKEYLPRLNYNLLPMIIITLGAFFIASLFFSVYGMAVDTLFLCFLEDCERNDGSREKPYYMSKELMKILDKQNKFREPGA